MAKNSKLKVAIGQQDGAKQIAQAAPATVVNNPGVVGVPEGSAATGSATRIAGLSVLKGLVLFGATLTFAGLYAYFMERIAAAPSGTQPTLNTAMVGAAAALAGVLGSAFALAVGVPTTATNEPWPPLLKRRLTRSGCVLASDKSYLSNQAVRDCLAGRRRSGSGPMRLSQRQSPSSTS